MIEENIGFDFQKNLKGIQEGEPFTAKDCALKSLIKSLVKTAVGRKLDSHLGQEMSSNCRNGKNKKTIKPLNENFELQTLCDRDGTFSPQIVKTTL